eukprot:6011926-Pleurochrysis_carterae.AAC.1
MNKFYTELWRRLLAVLRPNVARSPKKTTVFIIRGSRHLIKHSCKPDASDWAAGKTLHIPLSTLRFLKVRSDGRTGPRSTLNGGGTIFWDTKVIFDVAASQKARILLYKDVF